MEIEKRIGELKLALPEPPAPVAAYLPAVMAGELLFISGMLPFKGGKLLCTGKLGADLTVDQGIECSRQAVLNALAVIRAELGDLDRVRRIVRLGGFVASSQGFTQQPQVLNGASLLLVEIFGEKGKHARAAVGAAELPLNAPVEVEVIVQVQ